MNKMLPAVTVQLECRINKHRATIECLFLLFLISELSCLLATLMEVCGSEGRSIKTSKCHVI